MERGGSDVELVSKTLQIENKLFYFDLKENPRGRYLKISEKSAVARSTVIVPVDGIVWFLDLFNYYLTTDEREALSKELKLDTKVFYFDIGENKRGRFLKLSEASANRNRSTIFVPAGTSGEEGWESFRNVLLEINDEASQLYIVPNQKHMEPLEHLPGPSDDISSRFMSGRSNHLASASELTVERLVELPPQGEVGSMDMSKVIRVDQKRFFFDLGSNNRGDFLRISEVAGADRSSIILPLSALRQFHETIGHFVDKTNDKSE
ncbi:transcription factor Pur-alpha 1-like [Typha latifolia]|uniref:transcription factor Pur-alpha 1-like n=1 Tax=Typha latifolia TaxID=4733 RepID=UPI003C304230